MKKELLGDQNMNRRWQIYFNYLWHLFIFIFFFCFWHGSNGCCQQINELVFVCVRRKLPKTANFNCNSLYLSFFLHFDWQKKGEKHQCKTKLISTQVILRSFSISFWIPLNSVRIEGLLHNNQERENWKWTPYMRQNDER